MNCIAPSVLFSLMALSKSSSSATLGLSRSLLGAWNQEVRLQWRLCRWG